MITGEIIVFVLLAVDLIIIFGFLLVEQRRTPTATLAWLLAVVFVPVGGVLAYVIFGRTRMARESRRLDNVRRRVTRVLKQLAVVERSRATRLGEVVDPRTPHLLALGDRISTTPATHGNACTLLVDAEETYASMYAAIERATHHVHVEFYIIRPDASGIELRDLLVERARQGVEVRVLADAVGSLTLEQEFWDPLLAAGGQFFFFSPVNPLQRLRRPDRIDFRNHRKILVIDGQLGFTGGINIGQEYRGREPRLGRWRDTHMRVEGPAVLGLQQSFAEDWLWAADELLEDPLYYPDPKPVRGGTATVAIVDSGPDKSWSPIHRIHVQAMANAHSRVWITNPYFVPDRVMQEALITAALRGVDVQLLVPLGSDIKLVSVASEAYFLPLLEAGVRIFRYRGGFVHAKTLVVDDWVGTVGSANMDIRSFQLNFELNAFVFDRHFCQELGEQFESDRENALEITLKTEKSISYGRRIVRAIARLLSPLL